MATDSRELEGKCGRQEQMPKYSTYVFIDKFPYLKFDRHENTKKVLLQIKYFLRNYRLAARNLKFVIELIVVSDKYVVKFL